MVLLFYCNYTNVFKLMSRCFIDVEIVQSTTLTFEKVPSSDPTAAEMNTLVKWRDIKNNIKVNKQIEK